MITIRNNVFETNSSSMHTLTLTTASKFDKWKKKEALYSCDDEDLIELAKMYDVCRSKARDFIAKYEVAIEQGEALSRTDSLKFEACKFAIADLSKEAFDNILQEALQELESDSRLCTGDMGNMFLYSNKEDYADASDKDKVATLLACVSDDFDTYDSYFDGCEAEAYEARRTLQGVDVVAFGWYGYC